MAGEYYRVADMRTRVESITHSVGLVIGAFAFATVVSSATVSLHPGLVLTTTGVESTTPLAYAVLTASQFVGFFAAIAAYLGWRADLTLFEVDLPSVRDAAWVVGGFVALYGINVGISVLFQSLGLEMATNQVITDGEQDATRFLFLIPVTLLFVAPAEELLFRGIVQGLFRRAYGLVPGVVLASALFGLFHWFALSGSGSGKLSYVATAAVLGLVLGALYELTDNITVPIAVHGLYNTLLFVGQYLAVTGAVA